MSQSPSVPVYVELGAKRVFAGAIEWPGWCRSGPKEDAAVEALLAYAPRDAAALRGARPAFRPPRAARARIVERLEGDAGTDFGVPSKAPRADARDIDARDHAALERLLRRCWTSFDRSVAAARGARLRTGPRGGGRSLDAIVGHVVSAEAAYVRKVAFRAPPVPDGAAAAAVAADVRTAVLAALARAVDEGVPERGPRGGALWRPRYFVRRSAWHVLDHAWEIDDRSTSGG
jgi:hypothetical protein